MKKQEIVGIHRFLSGIKLNKLSDRTTRNNLISLHLKLHKVCKDIDADIEEMRNKIFEGYKDQLPEVIGVNDDSKIPTELKPLLKDFNKYYVALMSEDVTIEFTAISQDTFLDAMQEQGMDFSMTDLIEFQRIGIIN